MADITIMIDTSILIDYYRKTDKSNSVWISLVRKGYLFAISSITKQEIYSGANQQQLQFWNQVLEAIDVLPYDDSAVNAAIDINSKLKKKRKQIDLADLFIAATALSNDLPFATLNKKHFDRIDGLILIQ